MRRKKAPDEGPNDDTDDHGEEGEDAEDDHNGDTDDHGDEARVAKRITMVIQMAMATRRGWRR